MMKPLLAGILVGALCLSGTVAIAQNNPGKPGTSGYGTSNQAEMQRDRATLARYEREQRAAKRAFEARRSDRRLRKAYVDTTVRLGTAYMVSPSLDRKVKYKMALAKYREALKVDPNNREAKNNAKMIEEIYRSMGRPIPRS